MESFNRTLFLAINAGADAPEAALLLARFGAEWLVHVVTAMLALAWLRGTESTRRSVLYAVLTAAVALAVNFLIATAWFHPRPFMIGLGVQHLPHAPDASFPSDHGTLAFAFAFGLLAAGRIVAALAATAAAIVVAWSRVYLGVHFPLDMAGSVVVSASVALAVWQARDVVERHLLARALRLHRRLCTRLRVPAWISRP